MATLLTTTTSKGAGNYVGETRKQLRDGFGVYNYPNRFYRYEGEWSKGKKHGHGKLLMSDGSFYEGQFHDGEIQGHGFRHWASSRNEYTGQFVKGELSGHGIMAYGDGASYEGQWMDNYREGEGKLINKDGSLYEGSFHNHKKHGEGKLTYSDEDMYEGDWVNGLHQGHGIMKYHDGTIYAGQWWGDAIHGEGSMIHASGLSYEGLWISGRPAVEAVALRVVGKEQIEGFQGRPFGFEVECVTAEGDCVQEEGRLLQVSGWIRVPTGSKKLMEQSADSDERLPTPFGFEVEPYYLTESLGDLSVLSTDNINTGGVTAPSSVLSTRPTRSSSLAESTMDAQVPVDIASESDDKEGSSLAADSQHDLQIRTTAPSQSSLTMNTSFEKGQEDTSEISLPNPPPTVRTTKGNAAFENLLLPPLPPGVKSFSSLHVLETRPETSSRRASLMKWKKAGSIINPNLIAGANTPTISEGGKKKKDMADIAEKIELKGKKKEKKDEKQEERLCKPGDYVIVVQDVTTPRFLDSRLQPALIHVRVLTKRKDKSKIDVRRN